MADKLETQKQTSAHDALVGLRHSLANGDVVEALSKLDGVEAAVTAAATEAESMKSGIAKSHVRQILMQDLGLSREDLQNMAFEVATDIVTKATLKLVSDQDMLEQVVVRQLQSLYGTAKGYGANSQLATQIEKTISAASAEYLRQNFRVVLQNVGAQVPTIANPR